MISGIAVSQSYYEKDQDEGRKQHKPMHQPLLHVPLPAIEHLFEAAQQRLPLLRYSLQNLRHHHLALLVNTAHHLFNDDATLH
jgi:hypothetical protein